MVTMIRTRAITAALVMAVTASLLAALATPTVAFGLTIHWDPPPFENGELTGRQPDTKVLNLSGQIAALVLQLPDELPTTSEELSDRQPDLGNIIDDRLNDACAGCFGDGDDSNSVGAGFTPIKPVDSDIVED